MEKMFSSKFCAKKEFYIIEEYKFSYHKMLENKVQKKKKKYKILDWPINIKINQK
jgi:hypothetical protein